MNEMKDAILEFQGEFRFLSNFYPAEGSLSVEHLYQGAKTFDPDERHQIYSARTPGDAKHLGRRCTVRPDWEKVKEQIMYELVKNKFSLDSDLKRRLLATGNRMLEEGNRWGDSFWGVDLRTGRGQNKLGRILMRVRRELREEKAEKEVSEFNDCFF